MNNTLRQYQYGSGNTANDLQQGDWNKSDVTQYGANQTHMGSQIGNGNSIMVTQGN